MFLLSMRIFTVIKPLTGQGGDFQSRRIRYSVARRTRKHVQTPRNHYTKQCFDGFVKLTPKRTVTQFWCCKLLQTFCAFKQEKQSSRTVGDFAGVVVRRATKQVGSASKRHHCQTGVRRLRNANGRRSGLSNERFSIRSWAASASSLIA
jgi:hypothetical protein